jgi:phospholipid/cholesterol/gamma-HCH transport system substrate-binding protein
MFVDRHRPPYKVAGMALLTVAAVVGTLLFLEFRGDLTSTERLTLMSSRAGLVGEPGKKVTYNGVEIGRVAQIGRVDIGGIEKAKLALDVDPRYLEFIPANVDAQIRDHGVRQQVHLVQLVGTL